MDAVGQYMTCTWSAITEHWPHCEDEVPCELDEFNPAPPVMMGSIDDEVKVGDGSRVVINDDFEEVPTGGAYVL